MAEHSIVIITHSRDIHADRVTKILIDRGAAPFRIDLDCFPRDYRLSLMLAGERWEGEICCERTRTVLDTRQVKSIWMRKSADFAFSVTLSRQERMFAKDEANHLLLGWLNSLDAFFMSHPVALRAAGWKCEQLTRARRLGFDVPPTLLSNTPKSVRSFVRDGRSGAIFKTLSTPFLAADQVTDEERTANGLHTTMINADDPAIENIDVLPGLFQHYVNKAYEVRVTVVADKALAARIDSQADERTRVDFRHYDADVPYSAIDLSPAVVERCCNFVSSYGLTYGAIDLIATPDGRFVFLENNPVGEFIFIEELVPELQISAAVADALIEGRRKWNF